MQAPHQRSGLTPLQYSLWLDSHTSEECLRSIGAALAAAPSAAAVSTAAGEDGAEAAEALAVMKRMCAAVDAA